MEKVPAEGYVSEAAFDVPPEHIVQSSRGKGWQGIDIAEMKQLPRPQSRQLPEATLRQIIALLEEHLVEDPSLSALAAVASLSPDHFARLFKESTGLSPHRYVIHRRVERAMFLLATTNWSLTTIAHAVGFAHESHLALHFKRLHRVYPETCSLKSKNLLNSRKNLGDYLSLFMRE